MTKKEFNNLGLKYAELFKKYDDLLQKFFSDINGRQEATKFFHKDKDIKELDSLRQELKTVEDHWWTIANSQEPLDN